MGTLLPLPTDRNVIHFLAEQIIQRQQYDQWNIADDLILMPNSRSARHLEEYLIQHAKGMLLPRIRIISELNIKDLLLLGNGCDLDSLPKAINTQKQLFLLVRLILQWQQLKNQETDANSIHITPVSATKLAKELNHLIRLFDRESIDLATLHDLDTTNLAQHWQDNYDFLKIISEYLPAILSEDGHTTTEAYKNNIIQNLVKCWEKNPPLYHITAVLTSGHTAATRKLLKTITQLPDGNVITPNINPHLTQRIWNDIDETHPLFHIKSFTDYIEVNDIETLISQLPPSETTNNTVNTLMHHVMLPTNLTDQWHIDATKERYDVSHFQYIECDNLNEEARIISTMVRYYLDINPKQNIAIVTNNFDLITLTERILKKWNIEGDNSIGIPIGKTAIGSYMKLILELIPRNISPVSFLALLKHPLTACELSNIECNRLARIIEIQFLRRKHATPITLESMQHFFQKDNDANEALLHLLGNIKQALQPLKHILRNDSIPFKEILEQHVIIAEKLAKTENVNQSLWKTAEGEEYAKELRSLLQSADSLEHIEPFSYAEMYHSIFADKIVRKKFHTTPNLLILSPSEARLIRNDIVIIADANDGSWPPREQYSPWLSTNVQKTLNLHSPERAVGEYASIFSELCFSQQVIITRSNMINRTPTIESHWLQRLKAVLRCSSLETIMKPHYPWHYWNQQLGNANTNLEIKAPTPYPPLSSRPDALSATDIDLLIKNPYAIYAKKILKLRKLRPIAEPLNASDFGNALHDILYHFCTNNRNDSKIIDDTIHLILEPYEKNQNVQAIWQPKLQSIMQWFYNEHNAALSECDRIIYEKTGSISYGNVRIHAKADRIEQTSNGCNIIDYKTGNPPSAKKALSGISPQMLTEALIVSENGFPDLTNTNINHIAFWRMQGFDRNQKLPIYKHTDENKSIIINFKKNLFDLISLYNNENTPYLVEPIPEIASDNQNTDYQHLSRILEWKYYC